MGPRPVSQVSQLCCSPGRQSRSPAHSPSHNPAHGCLLTPALAVLTVTEPRLQQAPTLPQSPASSYVTPRLQPAHQGYSPAKPVPSRFITPPQMMDVTAVIRPHPSPPTSPAPAARSFADDLQGMSEL